MSRTLVVASLLIIAGCGIPPAHVVGAEGIIRIEGPVLYRVHLSMEGVTSLPRMEAEAEASRICAEFLSNHFDEVTEAPDSVREAAGLFPERVRKEYAPVAVLFLRVEEGSGYRVRATLRIFDLRPWVDAHYQGFWTEGEETMPPLHLEDHAEGEAERWFLWPSRDDPHLLGEAIADALSTMGATLDGNPWIRDFYRLAGAKNPIADGPRIGESPPMPGVGIPADIGLKVDGLEDLFTGEGDREAIPVLDGKWHLRLYTPSGELIFEDTSTRRPRKEIREHLLGSDRVRSYGECGEVYPLDFLHRHKENAPLRALPP